MDPRKTETRLAWFTVGLLVVYFPAETWASVPYGLTDPFYLVDLVAILLLLWGAVVSLRARPRRAPGVLCAAYGWTAANGWRATFGRLEEIRAGGTLDHGTIEMWAVGLGTLVVLVCFGLTLWLVLAEGRTR